MSEILTVEQVRLVREHAESLRLGGHPWRLSIPRHPMDYDVIVPCLCDSIELLRAQLAALTEERNRLKRENQECECQQCGFTVEEAHQMKREA